MSCPCCGGEGTWVGFMMQPEGEVQVYNCYPCDQKYVEEDDELLSETV